MLGERCPSGRDSSLNLLFLVFVSGAVFVPGRCCFQRSRSIDVAFNVLDLMMCRFPSSPLSSTCSSSDPDFNFHQLIPLAFVVAHVVY